VTLRGDIWALDNIYLGDGCPWMCSGHGYCRHGLCEWVKSGALAPGANRGNLKQRHKIFIRQPYH